MFFSYADTIVKPIVTQHCQKKADIIINNVINDTVYKILHEKKITYSDLSIISKDNNNQVCSIEIDTVKISMLKAAVVKRIQNSINKNEKITVAVPLGSILGSTYTAGRGPGVNFSFKMSCSVISNAESKFTMSGINQTMHQILLNISSQIYLNMPWFRTTSSIETNFIIAETIIVGATPDAFTNVKEAESKTIGDIFDYSAEIE